jgi:S1-C subfamily serine protease
VAGKPLTKAGVRQGDQITAIDGAAIKTSAEARRLLRRKLPGDTAVLRVTRGPDKLDLTITLGR